MAYDQMLVAPTPQGEPSEFAFEKILTLAAPGNSVDILVPDGVENLSMTLSVSGGGTGKVQVTTDNIDTVKAGTAVWIDWPAGTVAVNTADSAHPVTAFRLVQVAAGATRLSVRAQ